MISTLMFRGAPALPEVGVAGSSAPVTSSNVTLTPVPAPAATETPVILPLRKTAGNVPFAMKAMTRTRYGPPTGTPTLIVAVPIPAAMFWLARKAVASPPPSITATSRVACCGMAETVSAIVSALQEADKATKTSRERFRRSRCLSGTIATVLRFGIRILDPLNPNLLNLWPSACRSRAARQKEHQYGQRVRSCLYRRSEV